MTDSVPETDITLDALQTEIRGCRRCVEAGYIPEANPVFRGRTGQRLMVVGQAPGIRAHLETFPFAGATGRALRQWLAIAGFTPDDLYERFYLTSVTKCFPGPSKSGKGDRAPSPAEIRLCSDHLAREIALMQPECVLAMGKLAISRLLGNAPLTELVGTIRETEYAGHRFLVVPLPHPSGVSHWLNAEANRALLQQAMERFGELSRERGW